jgi:phospholipid transport system substrate-binding protein
MLKHIFAGFLLMLSSVIAIAAEDPQKIVKETAQAVLNEVVLRKAEFEADPSLIYPLIESAMKKHLDFERITRSAMGRFWPKASAEQKESLVAEFEKLLVRTYTTALLNYSGQEIEYPPARIAEDATKVLVPSKIRNPGAPAIPIDYSLYLGDDGLWKVYDVSIDGISLVGTYRGSFNNEIRKGAAKAQNRSMRMSTGIDHLIASLAAKNAGK